MSGCTRVSTEEPANGGVSLEMQAERIRAYCNSQGSRSDGPTTEEHA